MNPINPIKPINPACFQTWNLGPGKRAKIQARRFSRSLTPSPPTAQPAVLTNCRNSSGAAGLGFRVSGLGA